MKTKITKKLFLGLILFLVAACSISAMASSLLVKNSFNITKKGDMADLKDDNNKQPKSKKNTKTTVLEMKKAGPVNAGGRIRALLWDKRDPSNKTLYAGGVAGGLYVTRNGGDSWEAISGDIANAAISCIIQDDEGTIYVGTGEGFMNKKNSNIATNAETRGQLGSGVFKTSSPQSDIFIQLSATIPGEDHSFDPSYRWSYVNELAYNSSTGYLYAATNTGVMYSSDKGATWTSSSIQTISQDIKTINGVVYFTQKISEVRGFVVKKATSADLSDAAEIFSNRTSVLGSNDTLGRIEIAVTSLDDQYIYVSVAANDENSLNSNGMGYLKGIFVSKDQGETWRKISPSNLFLFNNGNYSNTIVVNPRDKNKILCGGYIIQEGEDINLESEYYWAQQSLASSSQYSTSPTYVHENIHAIVFSPNLEDSTYLVASDGGISRYGLRKDGVKGFQLSNYGLNITQFFSVAVGNDGSVIGGIQGNSSAYVKIPSDSARVDFVSYFPSVLSNNSVLPSYYKGYGISGGSAQSSMFSRTLPGSPRKPILVSEPYSTIARTYANYNDYDGSQAWNYGDDFSQKAWSNSNPLSNRSLNAYAVAQEVTLSLLWETTVGTSILDSAICRLVTGMRVYEKYEPGDTSYYTLKDSTTIKRGSKVFVRSSPHLDYPFFYTFTEDFYFEQDTTFNVSDPVQSRYFLATKDNPSDGGIYMTSQATNFSLTGTDVPWYKIFTYAVDLDLNITEIPRAMAISTDGDHLFIAVNIINSTSSKIYRISNLLQFTGNNSALSTRTIYTGTRSISSISVDPQNPANLLITCDGINSLAANILYSTNGLDNTATFTDKTGDIGERKVPVYASLIEMHNSKTAFVGTDNGLYMTEDISASSPVWQLASEDLQAPVYMIRQQTNNIAAASIGYTTEGGTEQYYFEGTTLSGAIYVATHGKGIFYCDDERFINPPKPIIGIGTVLGNPDQSSLKVYPNPVKDNVNIEYTLSRLSKVSVKIFNVEGKLFYQKDLGAKNLGKQIHTINCTNMPKGVYVIQVLTGSEVLKSKMIVN